MQAVSNRKPDEVVALWPDTTVIDSVGETAAFRPYLECYFAGGGEVRPALTIFPGGGYRFRAPHEAVDIAERFNRLGFHAFVVQYRVAPYRFPEPQRDALRAIRLIRSRAEYWKIDPDRIAVCGFSAGGHLAACTGTLFDGVNADAGDEIDAFSCRPDGLVLCYPVISFGEFGHRGSAENLLGPDWEKHKDELSLQNRVSAETPPTFLWHTAPDAGVPVENSFLFARAMRAKGRPWALHVFPDGPHGIGLAPDVPEAAVWPELAATFLRGKWQ
jgi:acetyl esterase/lipase